MQKSATFVIESVTASQGALPATYLASHLLRRLTSNMRITLCASTWRLRDFAGKSHRPRIGFSPTCIKERKPAKFKRAIIIPSTPLFLLLSTMRQFVPNICTQVDFGVGDHYPLKSSNSYIFGLVHVDEKLLQMASRLSNSVLFGGTRLHGK